VDSALEVSTAQVKSDCHIGIMSLKTIIVEFDISIEDIVRIDAYFLHSFNHADCTEIGEKRVIDLNISASSFVQIGYFLTVCLCNVGKVTFFSRVNVLVEGEVSVAKMEPFWSSLYINPTIFRITMVILIYLTSSLGTFLARKVKAST
jgi:hypothetical protein